MIRYDTHAALARETARGNRYRATLDMAVPDRNAWLVLASIQDSASRVAQGMIEGGSEMRFFRFGKKRAPDPDQPLVASARREEHRPKTSADSEIVVYGTSDGVRCREVRALIEKHGYAYRDVRVDEDLSTRSWLQRLTGDNALPKVFIGPKCYGGFEDIQVLMFDGRFERILCGEADPDGQNDEWAALREEMSPSAISTLLRQGEILTITEGEMAMDAWAEPLANPPLVYYEGIPHPIDELEGIVEQIIMRLEAGEIEVSWKEDA